MQKMSCDFSRNDFSSCDFSSCDFSRYVVRLLLTLSFIIYHFSFSVAQIKIGGNVYGGGNEGQVKGSTKVTVLAGDIGAVPDDAVRPLVNPKGKVFGGARMANVGGNTFVHIDGEHFTTDNATTPDYIVINQVYGGNDIAGKIGTASDVGETVPTELTAVKGEGDSDPKKNVVDNTFNSYVRVSTKVAKYTQTEIDAASEGDPAYGKTTSDVKYYTQAEIDAAASDPENPAYGKTTSDVKPAADAKKVYIGQLFAGGNGDYHYEQSTADGKTTHNIYTKDPLKGGTLVESLVTDEGDVGFQLPETDSTYLEVVGGSIVYAYGGGNNATVREHNIIHVDNPSAVVNHVYVDSDGIEDLDATEDSHVGLTDLLTTERFMEMGINTTFSLPSSGAYQVGRFFGGNNQVEMTIRPTWNLLAGKIRNLYSGGNKGDMTSPEGLLMEIKDYSTLIVDNLYGGCRMADVKPTVNGEYMPTTNLEGYHFPNELSARTLVSGGHVNNVYGGNDVTGSVYGGNAVGIYSTVYGNVYGGGNGAYPYTDNESMEDDGTYGDFYYGDKIVSGQTSYEALNAFRPNAEQVSIRLAGTDGTHPTVVRGSVFVGGNCASLATKKSNPMVELKIGSYVVADTVFLGNNGAGMINKDYLKLYADNSFSSLTLTDASVFAGYMEGVAMNLQPSLVFDNTANGDPATYLPYTSYVGSFFCGGNVGSMAISGKETFTISQGLNIYDKFVGGCNNADVPVVKDESDNALNAAYEGGVIGSKDERGETSSTFYTDTGAENGTIKDRLEINLDNLTIVPLRWSDDNTRLIWNTNKWSDEINDFVTIENSEVDDDTRLLGGNVYGGCYESGHVNGNVVININEDVLKRDEVFGDGVGIYGRRASRVNLEEQRFDLMAVALTVFGGGYGKETEIWGSTTVNHNNGYVFQIFGGGEQGVVGKKTDVVGDGGVITREYEFNPAYSSTVNLNGAATIYSNSGMVENLAETESIYGGGNKGDVCGNTLVNLGNGRLYDAFGGASDADILGHSEVYIGRQPNGSGGYKDGFPWIMDIVYGGNDFGGTIHGAYEDGYDFAARLRDYDTDKTQLHGYKAGEIPDVLKSSSYVEYLTGRVDTIFGGGYGYYDYSNTSLYGSEAKMPEQHSAFVNIRPKDHAQNLVKGVFGGGTGYPGNRADDEVQDRSYVLIDIPDGMTRFTDLEVFGGGSYNGLGMGVDKTQLASGTIKLDEASAIVDLLRGRIHNAYGGSYQEGVTRRTVVNVPAASSIQIDSIYGGAYGKYILPPCDVYETQVNYKNTSGNAQVFGAIFGGNNNERRSLFTQVNISSPVWSNKEKGYTGTVYGAGRGIDTWSEHTEVNLLKGARVYEVYGGGEMGHVLNSASVQAYMKLYENQPSPQIGAQDAYWKTHLSDLSSADDATKAAALARWQQDWKNAWKLGDYYDPSGDWDDYAENTATSLAHFSNRAELDDKTAAQLNGEKKFNTNVIVSEGAVVDGYVYGGGLGDASVSLSGDVYGSTYVAVLGGEVKKDVYAGGRAGGLDNLFGADSFSGDDFIASANVYVQGGTARNVYGGGYLGHVGHHTGDIRASYTGDRLAKANVVIGKSGTNTFTGGAPAITRNVYGAGEGGSVYGTAKITFNNGYVGYRYKDKKYVEELDDVEPGDLDLSGNIFGGGYVVNSYVDSTVINMYGGQVRGSLFGGGELGPVGRGALVTSYGSGMENGDATIFRAGHTEVNMYDGHVLRNVFGGGRGKDSWGGDGTKYMDKVMVASLKTNGLFCKGYVFGQTRVNIYGGEVGTDEGMAYGFGNVFGGGDEGYVYSAYMEGDELHIGKKAGVRYNKGLSEGDDDYNYQGYYFEYDKEDGFLTKSASTDRIFTEDCKVLVEPHCMAYVDIAGSSYKKGDYVPTSFLNTLKDKDLSAAVWDNLDPDGIIIHNAVFAGGNIAAGSSSLFANATTVYGNATASIHDAYNRDLITIGTGHTGGLYGDGNLTFVDGYRELNITNYGTDYYYIKKNDKDNLSYDEYLLLPEREKAYYEVKYKCKTECTDLFGTTYTVTSNLPMDELLALFTDENGDSKVEENGDSILITVAGKKEPNPDYWVQNGVVSIYAGRIMNTIQRADLCGVFGSRMVMKGARDRVPETVDYTNYTINRVREVSLNKKASVAGDTGDNATHGNYFGIYSVVNYLGALTSDVKFSDIRKTTNSDTERYQSDIKIGESTYKYGEAGATFYNWKRAHISDKTRNNGTCHNQLALASGVYLELTTEESTGTGLDEKVWGPITGVVELDLINVQPGIGGGFVYAKNEHGDPSLSGITTTTLTELNTGAATQWDYNYETDDEHRNQWETTGNFIHSTQTIIDDCYNISNRYLTAGFVPAHYWYIAGSVYVYDQYISAYTGSPNAYSKTVELPITISAASHGTMTLMDVQPNLYAFYSNYVSETNNTPLTADNKLVINDVTYERNTPISYWDWNKLPAAEKRLFVADTYVVKDSCYINSKFYPAGYVMLPSEQSSLWDIATNQVIDGKTVKAVKKATVDADGNPIVETDANDKVIYAAFDDVFRSSNNLSHDTGYLLTYNVTNPTLWNKWYTEVNSESRVKNQTGGTGYEDGPTYHPTTAGLYGQQNYSVNAIITEKTYDDYQHLSSKPASGQATFVSAYLVTSECTSGSQHYYPGAPVAAEIAGHTAQAYVSTATIQLSATEYIYVNDLMTWEQKKKYMTDYAAVADDIDASVVPAYICTTAGLYGGSYYETGKNYRALEAYSSLSPADREQFAFNYDALDLLIDPEYSGTTGQKYQYDSEEATKAGAEANAAHYSLRTPINYTATYNSDTPLTLTTGITVKRNGVETPDVTSVQQNDELESTVYEALPNERHHYAPISVAAGGGTYYVVKESFVHNEHPYAVGSTIDKDTYDRLSDDEQTKYITTLTFTASEAEAVEKDGSGNPLPLYYCREAYTINAGYYDAPNTGAVKSIKGVGAGTTYSTGEVPAGIVISNADYVSLVNKQLNFTIHGESPMETSTLYVSRNADINDLSTEKIITVIYKYDYEESDTEGTHITPVSERHVVNIHITFKSGVPMVDDINPPSIVLPGTGITMRIPSVTPGAYEVIGGGWELFEKPADAESHVNGVEYTPSVDPLYWYQDGFYLAYYAKTYLGKTYSNHVPVSVANYHDLKEVMDDKQYHLHVDYDRSRLKRDSKIYINDYSASSENGLYLLKDLYDLSLLTSSSEGVTDDVVTTTGRLKDHHILNQVNGPTAGDNLEFFLRTDIAVPSGSPAWTPIGTDDQCFEGTLHGDGHTVSGLDNSLFYNLCGSVYNLGVTGSFSSAGVVDKGTGYVESSWTNTTASSGFPAGVRAVFGDPSAESGYKQLVNCYYQTGKDYSTTDTDNHGLATAMPDRAFYNGEVAYNLNNFYLYKRYSDHTVPGGSTVEYKYWKPGEADPQTGRYASNAALCSSGYDGKLKYVEDRFADGDFRYAAGEIPTSEDERRWIDTDDDNKAYFFPIWPDDYLFFGQKLTYGWASQAHQPLPSSIARIDGRLSDGDDANRVYRSPAYYRSSEMGLAHFNPAAYIAFQSADGTTAVTEKPMTAIDFSGHYGDYPAYGAYSPGLVTSGLPTGKTAFYPPLLDDDGLTAITNCDVTQNLLVYAPSADANAQTLGVLTDYFTDPAYTDHYDNSEGYRLVAEANTSSVHGHLVQSDLTATNDHLLVDKQDFNAPIAYTFDGDHLMWYQRTPANNEFVDTETGWQGISVPFTAELVTTHQKGEITHFYSGSTSSANGTGTKIGHEYWLRSFTAVKEEGTAPDVVAKATFQYPRVDDGSPVVDKSVTNTFLWDYYYKNEPVHNQHDANADTYLQYRQYYKDPRTCESYPQLTAATPYIMGLPGKLYYEFDLSGSFTPQNTAASIAKLGKQVVTLASNTGITVGVSDGEMAGVEKTESGTKSYTVTFKPNYMNETLENGNYVMNTTGNAYKKLDDRETGKYNTIGNKYADAAAFAAAGTLYTDADGTTPAESWADAATTYYTRVSPITYNDQNSVTPALSAFRPYFTATVSGGSSRRMTPNRIVFGSTNGEEFEQTPESVLDGSIEIFVRGRSIVARSHREEPATIRIVNVAGITLRDFVLEPGQTVETPIRIPGVYMANRKKLFVK